METTLYLVHNNGEYSAYQVLALFTDKTLAETFARHAHGAVEEWAANIPQEKWTNWTGQLEAEKTDGKWVLQYVRSHNFPCTTDPVSVDVSFNDERTRATGRAVGQSQQHVEKLLID